ncbi:MAG: RagB/SusD family nutrient uptake outer membrane protein, partial [Cyclobacteriaceae bacterium]
RDYLPSVTGPRGDERFANGEGWSVAVPSMAVYDTWNDGDYRKQVAFDSVTIMGDTLTGFEFWGQASRGVSRPHIAKYFRFFGQAGLNGRDSDHNYPAMRYAEVLLIAAEAINELNNGPDAEAEGYLNEVRSRARRELDDDSANDRTVPVDVTVGLSKQDFLDEVLEERRLELAFEFKRWYDIVRRDLGDDAFGSGGLEPNGNFSKARDYLFPKPEREIVLTQGINQNFGY